MNGRSDSVIAAWLALFLFGIYLLSYSGQLYSQDSQSMFSVTESFVKRGEFNTDQMWTLFKARNELAGDGESYAKYGYGASLFAVPFYAVALTLPGLGLVQTSLLASSMVIALAGALVFLAARRLRYSTAVSLAVALAFGLATPAWVYAKQFWSEPFGLFTLFATFYFLLRYRETTHARDAGIAGLALGLAMATRVTNAAFVPLFLAYGFVDSSLFEGRRWRGLAAFAVALGLVMLSIAWYDWTRYGSPLATGYRADETFDNPILLGLYGLLFSPGKGLFVYVPLLAVLPFSAVVFFQRARREGLLIASLFAFYAALFSAWYYWWGGTNWGPRFLVPTLPFVLLLVAPAVELALSGTRRAFAVVVGVLALLSFAIELLGVSIPSLAHRLWMLRVSSSPEADAIFFPRFSPLVSSFELFKPKLMDFAWMRLTDIGVSIDWMTLVLGIVFAGLCAAMLVGKWQAQGFAGRPGLIAASMIGIALALFAVWRYADDARFGAGDGYRAMLQAVQGEARSGDVLILNNDVFMPFLLNEHRAPTRWYGLSRDPKQWDEPTRALLARLERSYARVWFAFDDSTGDLPDPTREWLNGSLQQTDEREFPQGVHLALYTTGARP